MHLAVLAVHTEAYNLQIASQDLLLCSWGVVLDDTQGDYWVMASLAGTGVGCSALLEERGVCMAAGWLPLPTCCGSAGLHACSEHVPCRYYWCAQFQACPRLPVWMLYLTGGRQMMLSLNFRTQRFVVMY